MTTGTVASEPEADCMEVSLFPSVPHWVVTLIRKAGFSLLKEAVKPAWAEGRTPCWLHSSVMSKLNAPGVHSEMVNLTLLTSPQYKT